MTENAILEELQKVLQAPSVDNTQNGGLTTQQLCELIPGYGSTRIQQAIKKLENMGIVEHVSYLAINIAKRHYWGDAYRLVKK